ncbi:1-acyl-sn-glycerol-3-phosphate acyltransferase (PlsC) (PDB:1IUQ) [Commensalibacter communis]|uniref:1-acyl-sn-glycerol-3-phosphate acyltransferase (PlsC) n=2 Tax=Commensalibacter communis TaxID=2972786 RepID=A0A9W4TM99_9PROT|nr:1-acyl-sn-glycerol-3-phosphate acyltransferase (PlsC) (PDB:1IUQ) [Commensalibacter communis]CAI3929977.1 1-acyl-sn-glycerol-3-phosphate acyltransferase (PlsC) (PDB:1IUQ) [Commensalibacter communis]CAI3932532.1 1-acyl-sn-glycerol-3-phosphate acyltransferase (PlsC) (PDB:1IUQ) [Commensalibacter communis]CAI3933064.1 1-acyl-sn-glycerol-3-phosphate acyltransferase (PlsC) (PDB:1IUQ) [Commensalibacter communis]
MPTIVSRTFYPIFKTFVISSCHTLKYLSFFKQNLQKISCKPISSQVNNSPLRSSNQKKHFIQHDIHQLPITYPHFLSKFSSIYQRIRAAKKIGIVLIWTILCMPFQSLFIKLPGSAKINFARFYWRNVSRILGLDLRIFGKLAEQKHQSSSQKRPIIYIVNHTSWLDIASIGGLVPGAFVAKEEIGSWPVISTLCRLGRVLFVSRQRQSTIKEQQTMEKRLEEGGNLILFPEGTSTEGSHLAPFLSSFFVLAKPIAKNVAYPIPIIQPISVVYDRLGMLPVNRFRRPIYSWYGDMELTPHLWDFCKWSEMRASIIYHQPLYPEDFKNRKQLSKKTWDIIATGTAYLRQGKSDEDIKKII